MQSKKNNRATGHAAEKIAANYLKKKGFKILFTSYQSSHLETDIIASKKESTDEILCFIECKYRVVKTALQNEMAFNSVSITKQKRLISAAKIFLEKNSQWKKAFCRFDVIIMLDKKNSNSHTNKEINTNTLQIHHFENAFSG